MKANFGFGEVLGHLVVWILIIIFTLGIGAFFFPYSFVKFVLRRTVIYTDEGAYELTCDLDVFSQLGHIILWIVISILTLGLGYIFYLYGVWRVVIRNTKLSRIPNPEGLDEVVIDPALKGLPSGAAT